MLRRTLKQFVHFLIHRAASPGVAFLPALYRPATGLVTAASRLPRLPPYSRRSTVGRATSPSRILVQIQYTSRHAEHG